jgi:hypothetical protein
MLLKNPYKCKKTFLHVNVSFFCYFCCLIHLKMRKIYLLLLFSASVLVASAQQLTYSSPLFSVTGPPTATLACHAEVVNIGSMPLELLCRISSSNATPGHQLYFCFGDFCYDTTTTTSPLSTYTEIEDSALLSGYVIPNNIEGPTIAYYEVYDGSGNSDTLSLTFTYNFTTVGLPESPTKKPLLSQAGPNPAHNLTAISYNIPSAKDARLVFHNLLGSQVKEIRLKDNQNTLILPVTDFVNGIYIYSLYIDGKPAASKRLVIAHK